MATSFACEQMTIVREPLEATRQMRNLIKFPRLTIDVQINQLNNGLKKWQS